MTVSQKPIKVSQISPVCFTGMKPDQHWLWQPNCYTYNYFYINSCLRISKHIVFAVWILSSNVFGLFPKLMYKKVNGGADSLLPRRSEHTSAHRAIKLLTGSFSTLCSRLWSTLSQPAADLKPGVLLPHHQLSLLQLPPFCSYPGCVIQNGTTSKAAKGGPSPYLFHLEQGATCRAAVC